MKQVPGCISKETTTNTLNLCCFIVARPLTANLDAGFLQPLSYFVFVGMPCCAKLLFQHFLFCSYKHNLNQRGKNSDDNKWHERSHEDRNAEQNQTQA
jgi:hypothetical protein